MKIFAAFIFTFAFIIAEAQKNYSGYYSIEGNGSYKGLTLIKIDSNHYKFSIGATGKIFADDGDGIFEVKKDSGVFKLAQDYNVCGIVFKFLNQKVEVKPLSKEKGLNPNEICSWDFGSHIFGVYPLTKAQKRELTKADFELLYIEPSKYEVIKELALVYIDTLGSNHKQQKIKKGDVVICSAWAPDSNHFIFVEYLSSQGDFVYGWMRKEDLQIIKK